VRRASGLAIALLAVSCNRTPEPRAAIDPKLAAQVPPDSNALLGLDLAALRSSPLAGKLPAAFAGAPYALIAIRGQEVLPVSSASAAVRYPPGDLLARAEPLARANPIWAVIRGGTDLPLSGNLANLNTLLQDAASVTLSARLEDRLTVDLQAWCPTVAAASRFEGSLRAILLLARTASVTQLQRDGATVRATLSAPPDLLGNLLR
jgi:hypothetical protein